MREVVAGLSAAGVVAVRNLVGRLSLRTRALAACTHGHVCVVEVVVQGREGGRVERAEVDGPVHNGHLQRVHDCRRALRGRRRQVVRSGLDRGRKRNGRRGRTVFGLSEI